MQEPTSGDHDMADNSVENKSTDHRYHHIEEAYEHSLESGVARVPRAGFKRHQKS